MRVLIVNWRDLSHPRAGGAEVYTEEVARRLVQRGHEVELFAAAFPGGPAQEERHGVWIRRAGSRWSVYAHAARHLRRTDADVVVDEVNTRPFFAPRHARGRPVVALVHQLAREFWFHETPLPAALLGRYVLEPAWLRAYRGVPTVTVSRSTADDLHAIGFRDVSLVHNGVDVPPGPPPAKSPTPRLAFLGRLTAAKRPLDALAAFARVRARVPDATLDVLGDGPLRPRVEAAARRVPGVTVHGRVGDATRARVLGEARALLVPGVREGWGRVILEANALGTPAVAYDVHGLRDAVVDGVTGLLTPPRPDALADAALRVLDGESPAMGEAARKHAASFSWETSVDRFEEVLRRAVG